MQKQNTGQDDLGNYLDLHDRGQDDDENELPTKTPDLCSDFSVIKPILESILVKVDSIKEAVNVSF